MRPSLIILAGGKGTRLRSVTGDDIPKPMVDIEGKPFLYWLIKKYIAEGFGDITVSTGYKSEVIENYDWPMRVAPRIEKDWAPYSHNSYYNKPDNNHWVVNGDTWICGALPLTSNPTIITCKGVDAGAQFVSAGKIFVHEVDQFYDIGTPVGLAAFKEYFKTVDQKAKIL